MKHHAENTQIVQPRLNVEGSRFLIKQARKTNEIKKFTDVAKSTIDEAKKLGICQVADSDGTGTWIIQSAGKIGHLYLWDLYFIPISVTTQSA